MLLLWKMNIISGKGFVFTWSQITHEVSFAEVFIIAKFIIQAILYSHNSSNKMLINVKYVGIIYLPTYTI